MNKRDYKDGFELWETLHSQERFLPRYPQDDVVRWAFGKFDDKQRKRMKVIDLGCGGGRHTHFFARNGFITHATDRSFEGVVKTKSRLEVDKLEGACVCSELIELPYSEETFDLVLCYGVLCYLERNTLEIVVCEINRILKKGGQAFIMTRSNQDFRAKFSEDIGNNTSLIVAPADTDFPAKAEDGLLHSFLSRQDVEKVFCMFSNLIIERSTLTSSNEKYVNNDWLIFATR